MSEARRSTFGVGKRFTDSEKILVDSLHFALTSTFLPHPEEVDTDAPGPGAYDPKVAVSKFHDGVAVFGDLTRTAAIFCELC